MAQKDVNVDLNFLSVSRVLNLPDATDPQEPATLAQLNAMVEGLAWKDAARVATQANTNLAAPGATIDGVTMVAGDRVLVPLQTAPEENGVYIWNGAAVPMTRAPDASTFDELEQAVVSVEEGTNAGTSFRQTAINGTIGVDDVLWSAFGTSAPSASETVAGVIEIATQTEVNTGTDTVRAVTPATLAGSNYAAKRYSAAFGDGSNVSYAITHNLGTRDVITAVRLNGSPYDQVLCEIEHTDANTVTVKTNVAPTPNQYLITVIA